MRKIFTHLTYQLIILKSYILLRFFFCKKNEIFLAMSNYRLVSQYLGCNLGKDNLALYASNYHMQSNNLKFFHTVFGLKDLSYDRISHSHHDFNSLRAICINNVN